MTYLGVMGLKNSPNGLMRAVHPARAVLEEFATAGAMISKVTPAQLRRSHCHLVGFPLIEG